MALSGSRIDDIVVCDLALQDGVNANCGVKLVQAGEAGTNQPN